MSVQSYLNECFLTVDGISGNLDKETTRLKKAQEDLEQRISREREAQFKHKQKVISTFIESIIEADKNVSLRTDEAESYIEVFGYNGSIKSSIERTEKLYKAREIISKLISLKEHGSEARKQLHAKNIRKALEVDTEGVKLMKYVSEESVESTVLKNIVEIAMGEYRANTHLPLETRVSEELRSYLSKSGWPNEMPDPVLFNPLFINALMTEDYSSVTSAYPHPLTAFKVLSDAFTVRFQFNFESDRPTNRLDKPEWIFNFFLDNLSANETFLTTVVQDCLHTLQAYEDRSAVHEYITANLVGLYHKLYSMFSAVVDYPDYLSHLIYECQKFDAALKARFYYSPHSNSQWNGVTGDFLAMNGWFESWLAAERDSALARYREIIESPRAWDIDYDTGIVNRSKPTVSGMNIIDLMEGITEHYSSLTSVNYRLRFFLEVQLSIFDKYYERLTESVVAFESMSSTIARAVGGISSESVKLVTGLNGIKRLCKSYVSLEYVSDKLEMWGEDLFFLELWVDIAQLSVKNKSLDRETTYSVNHVNSASIPETEDQEGTLFDETIASYKKLMTTIIGHINKILKKEIQTNMKEYFRKGEWSLQVGNDDFKPSSTLVQPLFHLSNITMFLSDTLSFNTYTKLSATFSSAMELYIWNYIIQANQFSTAGGQQLGIDVSEIWSSLGLLKNSQSYLKLIEAVKILTASPAEVSGKSIEAIRSDLAIDILSSLEVEGIYRRRT